MQYVIALISVLVGGVLYLFNQNQKLKSDKKLSDSKIEDAKLETKQEVLIEQSSKVESELKNLNTEKVNEQQSAEDFWKNRG